MSRLIKFRAWIVDQKCFYGGNVGVMPAHYTRTMASRNDSEKVVSIKDEKYELNQYTGFKDIKGVEVYEGDLLAWPDWHDNRDNDPMPVEYEYGAFVADGSALWDYAKYIKRGGNKYATPTNRLEELEVVGNIYEGDKR